MRGEKEGMARRLIIVASAMVLLGACESWMGVNEEPPLPGKRISVLLHQRELVPDPKAAQTEILLPAPTINPDWPQPGGYANHAMHHIDVEDNLRLAWEANAGAGSDDEERLVGSPIVATGRVFVMDAETAVGAYDAGNGNELWQIELTPEEEDDGHIGGGIAYDKGRVFATTGFAQVIALDSANGAVLWRKRVDGPVRSAPTVRGGRVFALTVGNKLYALNAANGETLWTHSGITETASLLGGASPAVDAGVVVVPYSSGELVALKVENGRTLWADSLAPIRRTGAITTLSHIRGRPVIDRGRVFAMSHGGLMVSIDLRSGRRIWDREIGSMESLWVAGDYLFTLTTEAEVACLSRQDGRILWVTAMPRYEDPEDLTGPIIWTGPILTNDRLIVAGSHGEAVAISPYTGNFLGRVEMPDGISVPPVAAAGSVYFLSDAADLVAYR